MKRLNGVEWLINAIFSLNVSPNQLKLLCASSCGGAELELLAINRHLNSFLHGHWIVVMALLVLI